EHGVHVGPAGDAVRQGGGQGLRAVHPGPAVEAQGSDAAGLRRLRLVLLLGRTAHHRRPGVAPGRGRGPAAPRPGSVSRLTRGAIRSAGTRPGTLLWLPDRDAGSGSATDV